MLAALEARKGEVVSGELLASELFVSRNAVWKAVSQLRKEGYLITASTKSGYCLTEQNDILSAQSIMNYLPPLTVPIQVKVFKSLSSTNLTLKQLAIEGMPAGTLIVTEEQTGGKGRLGRSFYSPSGTGIYMSLLLRPSMPANESLHITTAAAVAVANAIEEVTGLDARIKWVNDIYIGEKKVCGILTEASFDMESNRIEYAILGIGINVLAPKEGFPDEIKDIAAALYTPSDEAVIPSDLRSRLTAKIVENFIREYPVLSDKKYMEEYRRRSFLIGRKVSFPFQNETLYGLVEDVDDEARLLIRLSDQSLFPLSSGEVSVKFR